jgi:hypothetical protein
MMKKIKIMMRVILKAKALKTALLIFILINKNPSIIKAINLLKV